MTRTRAILALAGLVVAAATAAAEASDRGARLEILDVGQGDAILVRSPEGKTALVDAGPGREVAAALREEGVTSLDLLVLSHHHADHYGGMPEVIRAFHPRVFLATDSSHTTATYLKLLEQVRDAGLRVIRPGSAPRKIGLGSVVLTVFPQPPENQDEENDNSIGLRVDYGAFSALLTGDSEGRSRAYWVKTCPSLLKDVTVLKLAHHGSRNGTDARWLDLTRPELAVASLGASNEYGHPHPETLALLARRHVPLLRTDLDGTISITTDGTTWDATASRHGRRAVRSDEPVAHERRHAPRAGPHATTRVDLNAATEEELTALPGIGPTLARRIVLGRPYWSVDDLRRVRGIGESRMEELRPRVAVRGTSR